ncbi:MAG: serine protease [Muribaculaceae bacterium]|nr:serine protease [Muribaculaceae bacterium]
MYWKLLLILLLTTGGLPVSAQVKYLDFDAMKAATTGKMKQYMNTHPGQNADSLRHNVIDIISFDEPVAPKSALARQRKKKLDPKKLYDLCKHSTLAYGVFTHSDGWKADTAYINASAVALTPDGICATNYHVISDVVINGALGRDPKNDLHRFLMDYDGDVFPLEKIMYINPVNDFAIIKVDTGNKKLQPAPLGDDLVTGDKVYCLANPSTYLFHFTDGMVSNCVKTTNPRSGQTVYNNEITAEYGVGSSGGPIFDEYGNLAALVSSTVSLYAQPQQNKGFQMAFKQTVPVFLIRNCFSD